jgi:hypothetical protein
MPIDTINPAEQKKLTNWKNEPSVRDLKQDFMDAKSYHDSQTGKIDEWLDNLHVTGKAQVNPPKGNSRIVPKLIRKQAEWRYAALSEPFLSTPDIFNVHPVSWEDTKAAQQNQVVLNNQFNTRIQKVSFVDEYVRTLVDEGTAIVRVGWEFEEEQYEEEVPIFEYELDPAFGPQLEQLMQLQEQDPGQFTLQVPDELKQALEISIENGQPFRPVMVGSEVQTLSRTLKNQPTVEVCDYRNVVIDPTCQGNIEKASFVIYSFESSLSELEKDGKYTNLDSINVDTNSILGEPDHASPDDASKNFNFADKPRKKFVVYEYWGYRDLDGSGVVKPFVAAWVGDTLIRMEENPFPDKKLPFITVQYLPVRKSIYGEPDGALLEDNQRIIGAVTRGMIDILGKSANGQTGIRKDMLDVTNRRKYQSGQDYEFNANVDPRQGVFMHTYPEIPQSAQFMLQLQNLEAESLTGVKSFNQGIGSQALGDVAAGIRGALDAASKRELGILRRLSEGMVQIGRKIIAMNAEFLSEKEVVRNTNEEFVEVQRDDLPGNFDLRLSISTAEEDNAKAQELAFMLQTMGNNMDPEMSRMILADIARLRKMPELAKRIENYQPQPDPLAQRRAELELQKLEAEVMKLRADAQKNMADAGKKQSETDLKTLDFVEQESGVKQERDLERQGAQARAQAELKLVDRELERRNKQEEIVLNSALSQKDAR